jgi:hypothetical protein
MLRSRRSSWWRRKSRAIRPSALFERDMRSACTHATPRSPVQCGLMCGDSPGSGALCYRSVIAGNTAMSCTTNA